MGDKMNREEKVELFRQSVASKENRQEFAESWAAMINEVLPIETSVRTIFQTEVVPAGAVPVYTNDVQPVEAWYLPKFGQAPQNIVEIDEVTVPTFEITSNVEYKIRDAKHGRINIAERSMQRLTDAMVDFEETAGWSVISAAATSARTITCSAEAALSAAASSAGLAKIVVDAAFEKMETNRDYKVTDIYVGPDGMFDIRAWTQNTIDPVTQRELFVNAGLPSIYGAEIHVVHFLPSGVAYFLDTSPTSHCLGYMPIRDELQTWDNPAAIEHFRVGVVAYEEVGFTVMDNKNIVKVVF